MADTANTKTTTSSTARHKYGFLWLLQISIHAAILVGPLILANAHHQSNSMLIHAPSNKEDLDATSNYAEFGFSIETFSSGEVNGIPFSESQQEAFGDNYKAAYISYYILKVLMWISLVAPLAIGLISKLVLNQNITRREFGARLAKRYARIASPVLIVASMLITVPFFLLWFSNLCGPSYMELQYEESGDFDYEGTVAIVHEDVPASCQIQRKGKVFLSTIAFYYPLILAANAWFMKRAADRLDGEIANDKANAILANSPGPAIKVLDDTDDDDAQTDIEVV